MRKLGQTGVAVNLSHWQTSHQLQTPRHHRSTRSLARSLFAPSHALLIIDFPITHKKWRMCLVACIQNSCPPFKKQMAAHVIETLQTVDFVKFHRTLMPRCSDINKSLLLGCSQHRALLVMLSTRELQKTLPAKAPNTGRHRAVASGEFKIPVYALVTLRTNLEQLVKDINHAEISTGSACTRPHADFTGRSLRDIYDYHLQLRDQDHTIHPLYFVVADQMDYNTNGILVVFLDADTPGYDDDDNHVGVGRTGIDMVDAWASNIDVGNMSWMDLKESEAADWHGDDPYEGIDYSVQTTHSETKRLNGKGDSKHGWYSTFGAGSKYSAYSQN